MDNGVKRSRTTIDTKPRIAVIDALRGMAIVAIFLIHTSNHFLYNSFPSDSGAMDSVVRDILYFIFENKAFTIFATLFGYTFALQMDSYKARFGGDFGEIMLWRMVLLMGIGALNGALFAGGDPLLFYAVTMVLVIPLRRLSTKGLTIISIIALIQPLEILNNLFGWYNTTSYYAEYEVLNSVMVEADALSTFWAGATIGMKGAMKWAIETGRFTQTIGLLLLGIITYRKRLLLDIEGWSRHYVKYIALTIVLYISSEYLSDQFKVYYNLSFVLSIVSIFVRAERACRGNILFNNLAAYGRMSLTNFVMQSLFGALLYYPWALDLGTKLGVINSLLITYILIVIQIMFSKLWLSYYKRGPLETIWHRATYIFK